MEQEQSTFITLSNGAKIPKIGLGTWQASGAKQEDVVYEAIKVGYRHIDTATVYENEKEVGNGINKAIKEGIIKREEIFVTTKIWNSDKEKVEEALQKSLGLLGLDYVDLYLIHWPIGTIDWETMQNKQPPLYKTWAALEACQKKGLTKAIGVSNFNVQLLLDLLSYAEIKPAINQVELHPFLPQNDLVQFCLKYNIQVEAYTPLANANEIKERHRHLFKEPLIEELSAKYKKTPAQIVLNWHLLKGVIVLPKTATIERLKENFDIFGFTLSGEDFEKVNKLETKFRILDPKNWEDESFNSTPLFA